MIKRDVCNSCFGKKLVQNLVLEEAIDGLVGNHTLIEGVGAFLALHHADDLGVAAAVSFARLQGCDCFFCHCASVYLISL